MSTQEVHVKDGTLAANFNASGRGGVDPRRRRFAINPGIYHAMLDPRESGRQEILLPVGLVSFRTASMANDDFRHAGEHGHNPNARGVQIHEDFTAQHFLANYLIRYGEQGGRELTSLTFMDDPLPNERGNITKEQFRKSAQGYFAALWPSFAEIGHVCPADLKECITCRLWLLGDPSEGEAMQDSVRELTSKLENQEKVAEIREEVVAALKAYMGVCSTTWAAILGELGDRKNGAPAIAKLGPGEHHVRRNLHEVEPSEAATAAGFGMEVAAGQAEGFEKLAQAMRESGGKGDNSEVVALIAQMQKDAAAAQARTDAILEQLARQAANAEPSE